MGTSARHGAVRTPGDGAEPDTSEGDESEHTLPTGPLEVRVVDFLRKPLPDALVTWWNSWGTEEGRGPPARTDQEGRVRWEGVPRALVTITVERPGFLPATEYLLLHPEGKRLHEVVLEPSLSVEGRVINADDGRPIAGAVVRLRNGGRRALYVPDDCWGETFADAESVATGVDGTFVVHGLRPRETYAVWAVRRGFDVGEQSLTVHVPDALPSLELQLAPAGTATVHLCNAAGTPVGGMSLRLVPDDLRQERIEAVEETEFSPLDASPWRASPAEDLESEVCPIGNACLNGSWFGPDVESLHVGRTDEMGLARFEGLRLGVMYHVTRTDRPSPWEPILAGVTTLRPTQEVAEVRAELRLQPLAMVRLRCTDPEGRPLDGLEVRSNSQRVSLDLDEAGVARFPAVAGPTTVHVDRAGYDTARLEIEAVAGGVVTHDVRMRPGFAIDGTLLDEQGLPYKSGRIKAQARGRVTEGEVGADGRFRLEGLTEGRHRLHFGADESRDFGERDVAAPSTGVRLTLPRTRRVSVRVSIRWPDGFVPDEKETWWWVAPVEGDDRGMAESPAEEVANRRRYDLFPGGHEAGVHHRGCTVLRRHFLVPSAATFDLGMLEPRFPPPAEGHVAYADGSAVPGAVVNVRGIARVTADSEGRFRLECGRPGPVTAVVGGRDIPASLVELPAPVPGSPWRIVVGRGGALRGHVLGESAAVRLLIESLDRVRHAPLEPPDLDAAARFLVRIAPGRYQVSARRGEVVLATTEAAVTEGETTEVTLRVP